MGGACGTHGREKKKNNQTRAHTHTHTHKSTQTSKKTSVGTLDAVWTSYKLGRGARYTGRMKTARLDVQKVNLRHKKNSLYKQRSSEAGLRVTAFRRLKEALTVSTVSTLSTLSPDHQEAVNSHNTPLKTYTSVRIIWSYRFILLWFWPCIFLSLEMTWQDSPQGSRFNSGSESPLSRTWCVTAVHWKWNFIEREGAFWMCVFEVRERIGLTLQFIVLQEFNVAVEPPA